MIWKRQETSKTKQSLHASCTEDYIIYEVYNAQINYSINTRGGLESKFFFYKQFVPTSLGTWLGGGVSRKYVRVMYDIIIILL